MRNLARVHLSTIGRPAPFHPGPMPMHHVRSTLVSVFVPGCCALLSAQSFLSVPFHADAVDGHHNLGRPFGTPGFRTQILIEAAQAAPNGAVLSSIQFRADRLLASASARQVPNVTVSLSHSSATIAGLSATFANNVTGAVTPVFQGTVTLPAQGIGFAGPMPWNIVVTFAQPFPFMPALGNLLIDIVGNNAPGGSASHFLDAVQGGGAATQFGVSGISPPFVPLLLLVSTGNTIEPRHLSPGHTIDFTSTIFFNPLPGVVALGTAPQPVPIDLGPLGAPTNFLYIDPIVLETHFWTQTFLGWGSTFSLPVPNNPVFIGATIYGQSSMLKPLANPLGLVLSHAVETRIGDEFEVLGIRQLDANDPGAATGTLVDFSSGPQPEPGAVAIRLGGVFF